MTNYAQLIRATVAASNQRQKDKKFAEGGTPDTDAEGLAPENYEQLGKVGHGVLGVLGSIADIPRRAFVASEERRLGGDYDPAPVMDAAMLTFGAGAGARGGLRPYSPAKEIVYERPTVPTEAPAAGEASRDVAGGLGGAPGGDEGLRAAELQARRWAGEHQPLEGLPVKPVIVDGELFIPGPNARAHQVAREYMADKDFGREPPDRFHPINVEHAKRIAQAFEDMPHAPSDPLVKAAYEQMAKETLDQYRAIMKSGLKLTPVNAAEYPYHGNPRAVVKDVADNNHMAFFKTNEGFGTNFHADPDHVLLRSSGEKVGDHDMLYNDLFRVVHDYFGHIKHGHGFRGAGEDNAWRAHAAMYSPLARRAMTTETRGQNSWLNYGPHGDFNRTANAADTIYADQKVGLMPEWTMYDAGWNPGPVAKWGDVEMVPTSSLHPRPENTAMIEKFKKRDADAQAAFEAAYPGEKYEPKPGDARYKVDEIRAAIREGKKLPPLNVHRHGLIEDGENRWNAYKAEGIDLVPVRKPAKYYDEKAAGGSVGYDDGGEVTTDELIARARAQLATQPERLKRAEPVAPDVDSEGMSPENYAQLGKIGRAIVDAAHGVADIPRRAFESSERMRRGEGYDPGPVLEAATLPMGPATFVKVPARAGEVVLGAGPARRGPGNTGVHLPPPKAEPIYYEHELNTVGNPIINKGVDNPPNRKVQTVADPHRMMFPGVYANPREIAATAAARVGEEDPAMKHLFGVTRGDLREMAQGRVGNEEPALALAQRPRGSLAAQNIQTPRNTQRLIDILEEGGKHEGLRTADAWYIMDPVYRRIAAMGANDPVAQYRHLNTMMGMASPGSDVLTEIQRGTAAHWLAKTGRFEDFQKYAGVPKEFRSLSTQRFPNDMRYIEGHPYHRTSQGDPMAKYLEHGEIKSDAAKVPLYVHASGVPETGFQTKGPVGDAHFSRGVGLADTRKGPTDVASSFSKPEYQTLQPWWQHDVAGKVGLESVPAQARLWTVLGPQTGVESALGAPKLELFAKQIMEAAKRLRVSPERARDLILSGKAGAGALGAIMLSRAGSDEGSARGGRITKPPFDPTKPFVIAP